MVPWECLPDAFLGEIFWGNPSSRRTTRRLKMRQRRASEFPLAEVDFFCGSEGLSISGCPASYLQIRVRRRMDGFILKLLSPVAVHPQEMLLFMFGHESTVSDLTDALPGTTLDLIRAEDQHRETQAHWPLMATYLGSSVKGLA